MNPKIEEIVIDGKTYVPKGSEQQFAEKVDNMPFVLIRGYGYGDGYGY